MSRGRKIAIAAIACLIGAAAIAWLVVPRENVDKATVGEALERFRQRSASGEGPGGAALGVYRYRTRGSERADAGGFLNATHDYDGVSTIILTRAPCGVRERWEVLGGRWSEAEFCVPPHGSGLREISDFHEFFGMARKDSYRCRGDTPSARMLRRVGTRFTSRCKGEDSSATSASRVVAATPVTVAGESVDAIRTTSRVALDGEVAGATTRDDWRRRSDGLLLRRKVDTKARQSGAIGADYSERYTMQLLSLRPRR